VAKIKCNTGIYLSRNSEERREHEYSVLNISMPKDIVMFNENSKIGDLLKNEAAKAVIEKHLPKLATTPRLSMAKMFTLKDLVSFPQVGISQEQLEICCNALAEIQE